MKRAGGGLGAPWRGGRWVPRHGRDRARGEGVQETVLQWGGGRAQSLQRRQPRPWLKGEHAEEGGGVQFGGEAGALGAGGARRPGEPVKNVLAF